MVICFECSKKTKETLDMLVRTGNYADYGDVITSSVANLAVLQSRIDSRGEIIFEDLLGTKEQSLLSLGKGSSMELSADSNLSSQHEDHLGGGQEDVEVQAKRQDVPFLFSIIDMIDETPIAKPPSDVFAIGQDVPIDRWIFGQYNRLLPAKASCRALARIISAEGKGVDPKITATAIGLEAAKLGDFLRHVDEQSKASRDDALAIAFPFQGKDNAKSLLRYSNQFVATVSKQGHISGMLMDLKLINKTQGNPKVISLTRVGWDFARLKNPVLDIDPPTSNERFSAEETEFLLAHIRANIPAELSAFRTIIAAILDGAESPSEIDDWLQGQHLAIAREELSDSFLSSQRSGAISRMSDLGLIQRVRHGVKVAHKITNAGMKFMANDVEEEKGGIQ